MQKKKNSSEDYYHFAIHVSEYYEAQSKYVTVILNLHCLVFLTVFFAWLLALLFFF